MDVMFMIFSPLHTEKCIHNGPNFNQQLPVGQNFEYRSTRKFQ